MNIKSLLLGSAAAFVAVSGARAADAVVIAEPEPMEYVRICDTYGVGFYYIPGTETCLKVSGYLRYDIGIGSLGHQDVFDKGDIQDYINANPGADPIDAVYDGDIDTNDTYKKRARFALRADARSETELGTLRIYAQVNFNWDTQKVSTVTETFDYDYTYDFSPYGWTTTANTWALNHAYIELGGFRVGKTDSLFSTFTGYSSGVSNDGLVAYGPFDTHQIAYSWNGGNGFNAAVALEEANSITYTLDSYVPNVVGGIGYTGGWGGVSFVAAYDSVYEEGAFKGRIDFNANDMISLFVMAGYDTADADLGNLNFYAPWGGSWAVWVGGAWKFNEKATMNFEVGYDDYENFSVAANVDYELVHNFHVIPEVVYTDNFDQDNADEWGGFLRLQANFGG
ncbi:MAG: porin [Alphaproteobacteria bacterium]|nr:porin [Alphaproteobacteria bacterium]